MYEYQHGGNAIFEPYGEKLLDLSANINPLGFPLCIENAIKSEIKFCNRYPDCYSHKLREKISAYENVSSEWIFCGNGASDIIFRIPTSLRSKKVLVLAPTFLDYERSAKSFGAEVTYYYLKEENGFKLEIDILDKIKSMDIDLVFICNPNNPTGVLTERSILEKLLSYCQPKGISIVVDECFMDFIENSAEYTSKPLLAKYDNLIILKAFTKTFALTGIRLGYALSSNVELIKKLYMYGPDWSVSNIAQAAGIAALDNANSYISETVNYVKNEREKLQNALLELNFKIYDSSANYVFFRIPYIFDLQKELNLKEIRIRSCSNFIGLSNEFYRVAVSQTECNEKFIMALKEIIYG